MLSPYMMCAINLVLLEGGYLWMQNPRWEMQKLRCWLKILPGNWKQKVLMTLYSWDGQPNQGLHNAIKELARESDVKRAGGFISWAGQPNQGLCKKHAEYDMLIEELVMEWDGNWFVTVVPVLDDPLKVLAT
ncbi:hypothetical protein AKJ16_DCAP05633 [Drosera capensis]